MTENERYGVILSELAEVIKEKNDTISLQVWQIAGLEEKLVEMEHIMKGEKE